jgi:hypothetical protein
MDPPSNLCILQTSPDSWYQMLMPKTKINEKNLPCRKPKRVYYLPWWRHALNAGLTMEGALTSGEVGASWSLVGGGTLPVGGRCRSGKGRGRSAPCPSIRGSRDRDLCDGDAAWPPSGWIRRAAATAISVMDPPPGRRRGGFAAWPPSVEPPPGLRSGWSHRLGSSRGGAVARPPVRWRCHLAARVGMEPVGLGFGCGDLLDVGRLV